MKRLYIVLISCILLVGCVSPSYGGQVITPIQSDAPLAIVSELVISPVVDVDYTRQLAANQKDCTWRIARGLLPIGSMRLSSSGLFSGIATKYGEHGSFTIEVSKGTETVTKEFTFAVGDVVWATPAVVDVGNFYPGARAEYTIKVHNDDSMMTDRKVVTTDATDVPDANGFITVPIPLNQQLHDNDIANVISIRSNNLGVKLVAESYDAEKRTLTVGGFPPLSPTTIDIKYVADAAFSVNYETYDLDVGSMVSISDTEFILPPHTTKEILVAIDMPDSATIDVKEFKFRIATGRSTISRVGMLSFAAVNAVTWNVKMR